MEQNTKLKSIESKTILACSYIFIFILINAILIAFISMNKKDLKDSLLKTMLHHAYALSSTKEALNEECAELRSIFSGLDSYRIMKNSGKNGRNN